MTKSTPILWADVVNDEARCDEQGREMMQLASEYGICDGITLPWHGANGHVGLLSFITSTPRTRQQWLSAVPFISWLSMHIFEAVARVCLAGLSPHDALSLRELEVCRWAAEGKQVSDIAQIPGSLPYRDVSSEQCGQQAGGQQQEPCHFMGIEAGDGQVERGDGVGCQCG